MKSLIESISSSYKYAKVYLEDDELKIIDRFISGFDKVIACSPKILKTFDLVTRGVNNLELDAEVTNKIIELISHIQEAYSNEKDEITELYEQFLNLNENR